MARLDYPDLETMHPKVRKTLESMVAPLNIFRISALAERNFEPMMRLGGTILRRQELPGNLRELAILRVARLSDAAYEWVQHEPIARATGCSTAQIEAIKAGEVRADCFDAREASVLAFTDEVAERTRPSDATLTALKQHLADREIMELTIAIGFYMLMARIMEVSGIELDAPIGEDLLTDDQETEG